MADESSAFGTWIRDKGQAWASKASEIWDNLYETDEEKKEALKAFNKKVTEAADKEVETEYEEMTKEDKEAYDLKRVKIYEEMKAAE